MSVEVVARWREDGTATCYGRLVARDATGSRIDGEGFCLKQADISSITFAVYDDTDPSTPINTGTVTISQAIFDTLQTNLNDPIWKFSQGFNFRHDLSPVNFPIGDRTYTVEYKITTTGGTVGWAIYRGSASPVFTS